MSHHRRECEVAQQAARAGGAIVRRYFGADVAMRHKESYNLVGDADVESEAAIARVIREAFPEHAILGEETLAGDVAAEHLWIVDPLDGTNNFFHRIEQFAVSVAYYHRGMPICGAIYDPLRDDIYSAAAGEGAFHNGRPVRVGAESRLDEVIVALGFYYDRGAMMEATLLAIRDFFRARVHGVRRFGAATLDLCGVAMGRYGAFFEFELAPWDFAAGRLFVTEAGGRVTNCLGESLPLAKTSLLATNGLLHEASLEILKPHAAGLASGRKL
jgi:myo-inositol-1(or 4)-monophosphatase